MPIKRLKNINKLDSVSSRLLLNTLDKADSDGLSHGICTAEVSFVLANILDHENALPDEMWLAGLFHDIGKLGIPKHIVDKKGTLSEFEELYVRQHPKIGKHGDRKKSHAPCFG